MTPSQAAHRLAKATGRRQGDILSQLAEYRAARAQARGISLDCDTAGKDVRDAIRTLDWHWGEDDAGTD